MYFETWSAVWQMDGHGPYVWAAYSLTAFVIFLLIASPWFRARQLTQALRDDAHRRAAKASLTGENHASEA
ncbi:MAG: heme exporter protein CcmD [Luminiphilus sp.]|nr:heme exporter protein CcmD [Luminiphilus sp.]